MLGSFPVPRLIRKEEKVSRDENVKKSIIYNNFNGWMLVGCLWAKQRWSQPNPTQRKAAGRAGKAETFPKSDPAQEAARINCGQFARDGQG